MRGSWQRRCSWEEAGSSLDPIVAEDGDEDEELDDGVERVYDEMLLVLMMTMRVLM